MAFNLPVFFLSLFGLHFSEGSCLLISLMMLFFNCFDFCDLSEIFFDGLCTFVEFFFPQHHLQIISLLPINILRLSLFFLLNTLLYFLCVSLLELKAIMILLLLEGC